LFSNKNVWYAIGAFLLGIAALIFYLFGGFEIFSSEKSLDKQMRENYPFSKFSELFIYRPIPFSVELSNLETDPSRMKIIDTNYVKLYIESKPNPTETKQLLSKYNYYAAAKLTIGSNHLGLVVMKAPKTGKFEFKYFLRVYTRDGALRSQMEFANFVGDNKFMNIREGVFDVGNKISVHEKGVVFSPNCDSVSSIYVINSQDYSISGDGIIDRR
jgi:hypothetical protein